MVFVMSRALATPPFANTKEASDHKCIRFSKEALKPFHSLKELPNSSSWFDLVAKLRHDVCQSHYRNDPVKYDLA